MAITNESLVVSTINKMRKSLFIVGNYVKSTSNSPFTDPDTVNEYLNVLASVFDATDGLAVLLGIDLEKIDSIEKIVSDISGNLNNLLYEISDEELAKYPERVRGIVMKFRSMRKSNMSEQEKKEIEELNKMMGDFKGPIN